ncbi:MAG: hypothetical protein FWE76_05985, partial [Symbiobacteriaceae bacterium]|nr:hypothetical protein [Symbiobacteriaceae bacterium]
RYFNHYRGAYNSGYDYYPRLNTESSSERVSVISDFIRRLCPEILDQLEMDPQKIVIPAYNSDFFYFPRIINGVQVLGEGITVYCDEREDLISSLYVNWTENLSDIQSPEGVISQEAAKAAFAEKVGLQLAYTATAYDHRKLISIPWPNQATFSDPYLVYRLPPDRQTTLDPFTGELYASLAYGDRLISMPTALGGASAESAQRVTYDYELSPEEKLAVSEMEGLLSTEELTEILMNIEELQFPREAVLEAVSYRKDNKGRYLAELNWNLPLSEEHLVSMGLGDMNPYEAAIYYGFGGRLHARMDATNGRLINYDNYSYYPLPFEEEKECLSDAELIAISEGFLQKVAPEELALCRLVTSGDQPPSDIRPLLVVTPWTRSYFYWNRIANGIPFDQHFLNIVCSPGDGKILSFYSNWGDLEFPEPVDLISMEEAVALYLDRLTPQLYYIVEAIWDADLGMQVGVAEARLIYANQDYNMMMVEAQQGKLLNAYDGSLFRQASEPVFADMIGHQAQDMVEKLTFFGLFRNSGADFKPQAAITQSEFLSELLNLLGQRYYARDLESMYNVLVGERTLDADDCDAEAIITARQALQYLLRRLGHREVAEMTIIFRVPGRIPQELAGYAAIGSAMGLLSLDTWQADKSLTRLDAAQLFYDFLIRP